MSYTWFLIVYALFGVVLLWFGVWMLYTPQHITNYLVKTAEAEKQPRVILKWLKYFLIFSFVSLLVSFYPVNLVGLLFSLACLIMVFVFGRILLSWNEVRDRLPHKKASIQKLARRTGGLMLTLSFLSFVLWYLHVNR